MTTAAQQENAALQRLVATARQLFAERGFHQTAMADLAKAASVSVGTIYRSFDSKADIIRAIIVADSEMLLAQIRADMNRLREADIGLEEAIERIVLYRLAEKSEALTHEILAEGHRNPAVADVIAGFCTEYRAIFAELVRLAQPEQAPDRAEGLVELLLACLFGIGHHDLSRPRLDKAATADMVARLLIDLLRGDPRRSE